MVFSSSSFLFLFLPTVVLGYCLITRINRELTNLFLLIASIIFYCWNGAQHLGVLLFSVSANYFYAVLLYMCSGKKLRKAVLILAICTNLGLLGYYKYSGFVLSNITLMTGKPFNIQEMALPIGISFYTFQAMSYVIDVYRGAEAISNPIDLGLYITFFPQLIAGPIVRFGQIRPFLYDRKITKQNYYDGVSRFLTGLCKKVILANNLGELADVVFQGGDIANSSILTLWLAAVAYTLQLYYDFSGYSDMAIGLGSLFGFQLPENFNYPYASTSVTDFWRRWHMTLSGWFRDYVYIPLGGSRKGVVRHIRNLLVVWILTGFWHGAAWQFLLWGLAYFILLIAEKYLIRPERFSSQSIRFLYRMLTMLLVCLLWVVFRAENLSIAFSIIAAMFGSGENLLLDPRSLFQMREYAFFLITGVLFAFPVLPALRKRLPVFFHIFFSVLLMAGTLISVSMLLKDAYNPFLYFQF